jgi:hypothetical protein
MNETKSKAAAPLAETAAAPHFRVEAGSAGTLVVAAHEDFDPGQHKDVSTLLRFTESENEVPVVIRRNFEAVGGAEVLIPLPTFARILQLARSQAGPANLLGLDKKRS